MIHVKKIHIKVELGIDFYIHVMEEIGSNFGIQYVPEIYKPSHSDLQWLVRRIERVMKDLKVFPPYVALMLYEWGSIGAFGTPMCGMDKHRKILYLSLQYTTHGGFGIPSEIHEDWILYHELMHGKDVFERRFPSSGPYSQEKYPKMGLITALWHFSIEGRLEKIGKPHKPKERTIQDEHFWLRESVTKDKLQQLCERFWGKEVTYDELTTFLSPS